MTKRNVMISITTSRVELAQSLFAEENDDAELEEFDLPTDEDAEPTELLIEGRLVTGRDRVELVWDESELSGMAGSVTTLGFDRSNPGLISMMRAGTVSTAMIFEAHKRHVSPLGRGDVRDRVAHVAIHACVHRMPRERLEGDLAHEPRGILRHRHAHLAAGLLQAAQHLTGLVGRDAT
jgi:hypothetical protein